jgi:hypothetical protein
MILKGYLTGCQLATPYRAKGKALVMFTQENNFQDPDYQWLYVSPVMLFRLNP